jgi:integrase
VSTTSPDQLVLFHKGTDLQQLRVEEERLMKACRAENTIRAYAAGWRCFEAWCAASGRTALPASEETIRLYATACIVKGYRLDTIRLHLSAISGKHRDMSQPEPPRKGVFILLMNAARELKEAPGGKEAITPDHITRISHRLIVSKSLIDARDRAIIVFGFALGWRRSELAELKLSDLKFSGDVLWVHLRFSKTDQVAKGRKTCLQKGEHNETCPIRAIRSWINVRGNWDGPLFTPFVPLRRPEELIRTKMSGEGILDVVKRHLERIGEDPDLYGAHSLRAGMVTAASAKGASLAAIMERTGHRSIESVLRYVRNGDALRVNPLAGVL